MLLGVIALAQALVLATSALEALNLGINTLLGVGLALALELEFALCREEFRAILDALAVDA